MLQVEATEIEDDDDEEEEDSKNRGTSYFYRQTYGRKVV
jgi:hypothetical protein